MKWWLLLLALCAVPAASAESVVICTSYMQAGRHVETLGTAVCIAQTDRGSILLTAKHNIAERPDGVWVRHAGDWHRCFNARMAISEDLATVETTIRLRPNCLADSVPVGSVAIVEGAGPSAWKTSEDVVFRAKLIDEQWLVGSRGEHVIPGDSGGPVLCRTTSSGYAVVGIVEGFEAPTTVEPSSRMAHAGSRTRFVPAARIVKFVQSQYGSCPGGICPIQIRQQIQQPMIGIGIPTGPPRIVNTVEPAPVKVLQPVPDPMFISGPVGPVGPRGPQGESGRSVTKQEVEAVVEAWLDANREALVGPAGPAGPAGPRGAAAAATDVAPLEARIDALERRKFRMVVTNEGKIIDDEVYDAGEPVVLDLKRLKVGAQ